MKKISIIFATVVLALALPFIRQAYAEDYIPELIIKAVSPGFTIDGQKNTGEFIELLNYSGDSSLSLAGLVLRYTNSSGNTTDLYTFPDGSSLTSETLLLRLSSSPEADQADAVYSTQLALGAGPLELFYHDHLLSSICWNGSDNCYAKFNSKSPSALVLDEDYDPSDPESELKYSLISDYRPEFDTSTERIHFPSAPIEETPTPHCRGLEFSELFTYYEDDASEQFIELHNSTDSTISLSGCHIKYKNKTLPLDGLVPPDSYFLRTSLETRLTKNPTSENRLILLDADDSTVDELTYSNGQKKGVSYASFDHNPDGSELWRQTYARTPGEANIFQEYRTCAEGQVINTATGNCVKQTALVIKTCPAGKYLNPLTGRCKSYAESSGPKPCKEGYERNPETNRCRKIKTNNGADYTLIPETGETQTNFVAWLAVIIILALLATYLVWQFRHEIKRGFGHLRARFSKKGNS